MERKTGSGLDRFGRGLADVMYDIPSEDSVAKVVVGKRHHGQSGPC